MEIPRDVKPRGRDGVEVGSIHREGQAVKAAAILDLCGGIEIGGIGIRATCELRIFEARRAGPEAHGVRRTQVGSECEGSVEAARSVVNAAGGRDGFVAAPLAAPKELVFDRAADGRFEGGRVKAARCVERQRSATRIPALKRTGHVRICRRRLEAHRQGDRVEARAVVDFGRWVVVVRLRIHATAIDGERCRAIEVRRREGCVEQDAEFAGLEVPRIVEVADDNFFASQVIMPGPGVGKARGHRKSCGAEVAEDDGVLVWIVEADAFEFTPQIGVEIPTVEGRLRLFELSDRGDQLHRSTPVGIVEVPPTFGLLVELAHFFEIAIEAIENADVVAHFAPLPSHLGSRHR